MNQVKLYYFNISIIRLALDIRGYQQGILELTRTQHVEVSLSVVVPVRVASIALDDLEVAAAIGALFADIADRQVGQVRGDAELRGEAVC